MATQEITIKLSHEVKVFLTDLVRQLGQTRATTARLATGGVVGPIQVHATAGQKLEQIQTELARLAEEIERDGWPGIGTASIVERLRRLAQVR